MRSLAKAPLRGGCTHGMRIAMQQRHGVIATAKKIKLGSKVGRKTATSLPAEVVVGIDLGTTNSAVAMLKNGKPFCIPNARGEATTPSVVTFHPNGDVVVGREARRIAAAYPTVTYSSVKRILGRRFDDPLVQEEIPRLPYRVVPDEVGMVVLKCDSVERGFLYPEEVSAQVLCQLLSDAEEYTGSPITKAVISVPAYFDERQKEATMNAGKLAGLETVRIIREPVAAALAYGLNLKEDQTVLVFDLGGGTYDISILEVGNGTVEVLATGGDAHLGGDDWDSLIVDWLKKRYLSRSGLNLNDPKLLSNMRSLAEVAKMQLADNDEVVLRMPIGGRDGGGIEARLTRGALDKLSAPLWKRCRMPLDQACWNAGVDLGAVVGDLMAKKDKLRSSGVPKWRTETLQPQIRVKKRPPVSRVLLVGGATRMTAVRSFIKNMTGLEPLEGDKAVNPDEAVALGAAVQAGILQGDVSDMMIMDQWQASLMRALAEMQMKQDPTLKKQMIEGANESISQRKEKMMLEEEAGDLEEWVEDGEDEMEFGEYELLEETEEDPEGWEKDKDLAGAKPKA